MRHNELKTKIREGVLRLGSFTVSELSQFTGLERKKVYEELAALKKHRFLSSSPLPVPDEVKRGRHRPPELYRLTDDPQKRSQLSADIAPFVSFGASEEDLYARQANEELNKLDLELADLRASVQAHCVSAFEVITRTASLSKRLQAIHHDLQVAILHSPTPVDEKSDTPLAVNMKRWRLYSAELDRFYKQATTVRAITFGKSASWPQPAANKPLYPAIAPNPFQRIEVPDVYAPAAHHFHFDSPGMPAPQPVINVTEYKGQYQVRADMAGLDPENIKLEIANDSFVLQAEAKTVPPEPDQGRGAEAGQVELEISPSRFYGVALLQDVDPQMAQAEYRDGILEVTLPISQSAFSSEPHVIIQASTGADKSYNAEFETAAQSLPSLERYKP